MPQQNFNKDKSGLFWKKDLLVLYSHGEKRYRIYDNTENESIFRFKSSKTDSFLLQIYVGIAGSSGLLFNRFGIKIKTFINSILEPLMKMYTYTLIIGKMIRA